MGKKYLIKSLKIQDFFNLMKERTERFQKAIHTPIKPEFPVNALARKLHPVKQFVTISAIKVHSPDCKTYTLVPNPDKGTTELAYFSSGQYLTFFIEINGMKITRGYSLSSAPKETVANNGDRPFYQITVKAVKNGLVSNYILENWTVGTDLTVSSPKGNFDYVSLRDAPTVIGIAGGSGITPFLSFAKSIVNGDENFNLILLYGNRDSKSILFKKELEELEKQSDKIKIVHVLSNQETPLESGFEKGFITADLIKKYAPADTDNTQKKYSIFMCGPQAMYNFLDKEIEKLGIEKKYVRHEIFGELHSAKAQSDYPGSNVPEVSITVTICDETKTVKGSADDTILQILEKNGIAVPNRCRSGECGWCHTLVKSGKFWVPERLDFRKKADIIYNYIHPCCTFALSDLELDVPMVK